MVSVEGKLDLIEGLPATVKLLETSDLLVTDLQTLVQVFDLLSEFYDLPLILRALLLELQ